MKHPLVFLRGGVLGLGNTNRAVDIVADENGCVRFGVPTRNQVRTEVVATDLVVLPGFVDTHIHGYCGSRLYELEDLADAKQHLEAIARMLPREGVTSFLPTTMTEDVRSIALLSESVRRHVPGDVPESKVIGMHLEGPFLSREVPGAHVADKIQEVSLLAIDELDRIVGDQIRLMTLDPLSDKAGLVRNWAMRRGFVMSAGHTLAEGSTLQLEMTDWKLKRFTHLFNAMPTLGHRVDSLAIAAICDPEAFVEIIMDGLMVDERWIELAVKCMGGWDRIAAVSDGIAATGLTGVRRSSFCGTTIERHGAGCWRRATDGAVWAPVVGLSAAVSRVLSISRGSWPAVVAATSGAPTRSLGLDFGGLRSGAAFDAAVVDSDGRVVATVIGGRLAYLREDRGAVTE